MEVDLLGTKFAISDAAFESERLYRRYAALADTAASDFDSFYGEALKDRDAALEATQNYCYSKVCDAVQSLVDECISHDIFEYNLEIALATYDQLECGGELASAVHTVDQDIAGAYARADEEAVTRSLRRASRFQVVGGGFGIAGALKGIADAAAINMVTGAAHGLANTAGNARSRGRVASDISTVLEESKALLREGLWTAIRDVYAVHVSLLGQRGIECGGSLQDRDARFEQAGVMFGHVVAARIPPEKQIELAKRCIQLDPAEKKYLQFLAQKSLGGDNPEQDLDQLGKIAKEASVDFRSIAEPIYDAYYQELKTKADRLIVASRLRHAAELLHFDNSAHSCRLVAETFTEEAVRAGVKGFLGDADRLSAILGDLAEHLPTTTEGIQKAVAEDPKNSLRQLAKEIVLSALDGDQRYLAAARTLAFSVIMAAFERSDVEGFFGGNGKIDDVKKQLLAGKRAADDGKTIADLIILLAPHIYKDAAPVVAEIRRYQAEVGEREEAGSKGVGAVIISACKASNLEKIAIGDRISTINLGNAQEAFPIAPGEPIFALLDDTIFGNNKNGVAFGKSGLVWRNSWNKTTSSMAWVDFLDIEISYDKKGVMLGKVLVPITRTQPEKLAALMKAIQQKLKLPNADQLPGITVLT